MIPGTNMPTYRSVLKPRFPIRTTHATHRPFSSELRRYWLMIEPEGDIAYMEWRNKPHLASVRATIAPELTYLGLDPKLCEVTLLTSGGFSLIYLVTARDWKSGKTRELICRIPKPIEPSYKTESEVAVTEFVRHFTSIPVPEIYFYDSSANNPIGLEWMLMEKAEGTTLYHAWATPDDRQRYKITERIAAWQSELASIQSSLIGSLYLRWTPTRLEFYIGPLVNSYLRADRRLQYDTFRGPYKSINEYYDAVLRLAEAELKDPFYLFLWDDKDFTAEQNAIFHAAIPQARAVHSQLLDAEEWGRRAKHGVQNFWTRDTLPAVRSLREALPLINCPLPNDDMQAVTFLYHHDASENNIMVDSTGNITALLDWESVSFQPAILHQQRPFPPFLENIPLPETFDDVSTIRTNSKTTLDNIRHRQQEHHQKWNEGETLKPTLKNFYYSRLIQRESILVLLFESLKYGSLDETPSELVLASAVLDKIQDWEVLREWVEWRRENVMEEAVEEAGDAVWEWRAEKADRGSD